MADDFLRLSNDDKREVLAIASDRSRRPVHLLEKDVWVVWALRTLYATALGESLVFWSSELPAFVVISANWSARSNSQATRCARGVNLTKASGL